MQHPAETNPANNPYNGFYWSSETGVRIDERVSRMSMITEYQTFDASPSFRQIVDGVEAVLLNTDNEARAWLRLTVDERRDAYLMLMGL